jgi:hypothetical protein
MVNQHIMILQLSKMTITHGSDSQYDHNHQMKSEDDQQSTSNSNVTAINANAACNLSTAGKRQSADPRSASRRLAPTSAINNNQFIDGHQLAQLTIQIVPRTVAHTLCQRNGLLQTIANQPRTQHWGMDNVSFHMWTGLSNSWPMSTVPNVRMKQMSPVVAILQE